MGKTRNRPVKPVLSDQDERLVGTREVLERIPIHRSTLNALISAKRFPAPLQITESKLFWRWSAILQWLDDREKHPVKRREFRNLENRRRA
jgi:predicted DNA-binding transcriptional regulator AlpA